MLLKKTDSSCGPKLQTREVQGSSHALVVPNRRNSQLAIKVCIAIYPSTMCSHLFKLQLNFGVFRVLRSSPTARFCCPLVNTASEDFATLHLLVLFAVFWLECLPPVVVCQHSSQYEDGHSRFKISWQCRQGHCWAGLPRADVTAVSRSRRSFNLPLGQGFERRLKALESSSPRHGLRGFTCADMYCTIWLWWLWWLLMDCLPVVLVLLFGPG